MSFRITNKLYPIRLSSFLLVLALGACGDDDGGEGDDDSNKPADAGPDGSTTKDSGIDATAPKDAAADASKNDASADAATSADTGVPDASTPVIPTLNGCAPADYMDKSGSSAAVITFGTGGNIYSPKCTTIQVGQVVRFTGNFVAHPLLKGTAADENAGSANNPITSTTTGTMKEFTFTAAGTYPYICTVHKGTGMVGSIHVK